MAGKIVGVFVADARADALGALVMGIAQVHRHGLGLGLLGVRERRVHRHRHAVGFGTFAHGDDGLRHGQPRLGHAHVLQRPKRRLGQQHRHGVGHAHILAGMHDHPPGDDSWVHPGIAHPGKPRQRGVAVRSPQGLAEGRQHVVIQRFVHLHHPGLYGLLRHPKGDMDGAVGLHGCGQHRQLQGVQRASGVAAGHPGDVSEGVVIDAHVLRAAATFRVAQRLADDPFDVFLCQPLKLKQAASADDGGRHGDHGVFRGGADEPYHPALDGGQYGIRLRLGPAMALVQQQIGGLAVELEPVLRGLQHLPHIRHTAGDGVELLKGRPGGLGDDGGQRGFAAARRAPEDGAGQPVGLDGAAQQPPRGDDVFLPDEFIQRARPHAIRQRRQRPGII